MGKVVNKAYRMDAVEQAEELYCVRRKSFDSISKEVGIAASTLKRWSAKYGWQERKRLLRKSAATLRVRTIIALAELIKDAIDNKRFDGRAFKRILKEAGFRPQRPGRREEIRKQIGEGLPIQKK